MSGRAAEQDRPDVAERRIIWRAGQSVMSPGHLVFIDETGATTNMARRYGHSPRGKRLDGPIRTGTGRARPLSAASLRRFIAPYVLDGAMNGTIIKAWVEQMLARGASAGRHRRHG